MPRQITTFEFKLIGFLTLKQFIYLVIFIPLGYVVFSIFPIPILNIIFAACVGGIGVAFAFVPINDRPLDIWIKNLLKRLTSPTQYIYKKHNSPVYFFKNLFFTSDPHRVMTHIESQEKLAAYLAKTKQTQAPSVKKQTITTLLQKSNVALKGEKSTSAERQTDTATPTAQVQMIKKPFFAGIIENHKLLPLPGILIYVKDSNGKIVRLLKTNPHGVFATFTTLSPSEYTFEFKDPKNTYIFDTIKIQINESNPKSLEIFSKELL